MMSFAWFHFLQYRISMVFLLLYLLWFLPQRYSRGKALGIAGVSFAVTALVDGYCFFGQNLPSPTLAMTLVQVVCVQATAFALSRYRDTRALFTGVFSSTYVLFGNLTAAALYLVTRNGMLSLLGGTAIHAASLYLYLRQVRSAYLDEMEHFKTGWGMFTLLPALVYAAVYALAVWPGSLQHSPENVLALVFVLLLMTAAYLLLFKLLRQRRIDAELSRDLSFLDACTHSMRHELSALHSADRKLSLVRHDLRHTGRLLNLYLNAGETEKALLLLGQMDAALDDTVTKKYCDNVTLNSILCDAAARAEAEQIAFLCQADVPETLEHINELELAIVILNLLENAFRVVQLLPSEEKRWIRLRLFPVKTQLMLEVCNPLHEPCPISPATGLPLSRQGCGHGYGLLSVRAFAEKNHAFFRIKTDDNQFCVRLMATE